MHGTGVMELVVILFIALVYLAPIVGGFWLLFRLVTASERTAAALERLVGLQGSAPAGAAGRHDD